MSEDQLFLLGIHSSLCGPKLGGDLIALAAPIPGLPAFLASMKQGPRNQCILSL